MPDPLKIAVYWPPSEINCTNSHQMLSRLSNPSPLFPTIVGLTACWQAFCPCSPQESVLVKLTRTQAATILVEEGRILMRHGSMWTRTDLSTAQDRRNSIAGIHKPQIRSKPIFLWENKENPFPDLAEELKSEGFQIQHCSPLPEKIRRFRNLTVQTAALLSRSFRSGPARSGRCVHRFRLHN